MLEDAQVLEFRPVEGQSKVASWWGQSSGVCLVRVEVKCFWRGEVEGKEVCSGLR